MSETISSRLENLTTPLQLWRGLGGVDKYTLYTRLSLQSIPVAVALAYVIGMAGPEPVIDQVAPWRLVLGSVYMVIMLLLALAVYEFHPDLNAGHRRPVDPIFRAGLIFTLGGLLISLLLQLPVFPEVERRAAIVVTVLTLFVLAIAYIPWLRFRWLIIIVLTVVSGVVIDQTAGFSYWWWVLLPFMVMTIRMSIWTVNVMKEVERSRELEASLRVTEERLRFAQELHDTLGQHLAAMSLKSEVALALAKRGDERLEGELRELQQLTRTSMSQMREVVQGYRTINLATEVEGAKSLLNDARITLNVHGDALDVAPAQRELAAWLVREATTNVLRHSDATTVDLHLLAGEVRMSNDGVTGTVGKLSGLSALRQRAGASHSTLLVDRTDEHFTVRLIPESST